MNDKFTTEKDKIHMPNIESALKIKIEFDKISNLEFWNRLGLNTRSQRGRAKLKRFLLIIL